MSLTGFNGCTALDLATLVDDKDSALVRLLAAHTIMVMFNVPCISSGFMMGWVRSF